MGKVNPENKPVVLKRVALAPSQKRIIRLDTPQEFIKTRPGKGKKQFTYVEGGYVVSKLNEVFSHVGWDFEILDQGIEDTEVWVRGKLTVKDPISKYEVSKTQYGTKERYKGDVPLGDTLKAAATDALKKCASLFGIAADVYWTPEEEGDRSGGKAKPAAPKKMTINEALTMIKAQRSPDVLIQWDKRIQNNQAYTDKEKQELRSAISGRVDALNNAS